MRTGEQERESSRSGLPRGFRTAKLVIPSTLPGPAGDNHSGLRWASVAERGVPASTVVKPLDVLDEVFASLCFGRVNSPLGALVFEHREERFSHAVVPKHAA